MKWRKIKFIDFILLKRGYDLTKEQIKVGIYPVLTSTSIMGYHNDYKVDGPGVITGRSGTIGEVQYVQDTIGLIILFCTLKILEVIIPDTFTIL